MGSEAANFAELNARVSFNPYFLKVFRLISSSAAVANKKNLSEFNKKLRKGLDWDPNADKKK